MDGAQLEACSIYGRGNGGGYLFDLLKFILGRPEDYFFHFSLILNSAGALTVTWIYPAIFFLCIFNYF